MTTIGAVTKHLAERPLMSSADFKQQATAAKRAATTIRQQLAAVGDCLSTQERATLTAAVKLLGGIAEAAEAAKRQKIMQETARADRFAAAKKAAEAVFADVKDAGGVVAMLAFTYSSFRIHRPGDVHDLIEKPGQPIMLERHAVRAIMGYERATALECFAASIAFSAGGDVEALARDERAKFDARRPALESKHARLVLALANSMRGDSCMPSR